jgi:hypothetical protein
MYKITINANHTYTVYHCDAITRLEINIFESSDIESIIHYCVNQIGMEKDDLVMAFDYSKEQSYNILEFGFNKMFTYSYSLLN